jgi:uncharacterized protein DUF7009
MKLRIHGNSIRFRLSQDGVSRLLPMENLKNQCNSGLPHPIYSTAFLKHYQISALHSPYPRGIKFVNDKNILGAKPHRRGPTRKPTSFQ